MSVPGSEGDFLDDGDDDEFVETTAEEDPPATSPRAAPASPSSAAPKKRSIRVKPMSASLAARFPNVVNIVLVNRDGSIVVLAQQKG